MTDKERERRRQQWRLLIDWADIAYFIGTACLAIDGHYLAPWATLAVIGAALIAWALLIARR